MASAAMGTQVSNWFAVTGAPPKDSATPGPLMLCRTYWLPPSSKLVPPADSIVVVFRPILPSPLRSNWKLDSMYCNNGSVPVTEETRKPVKAPLLLVLQTVYWFAVPCFQATSYPPEIAAAAIGVQVSNSPTVTGVAANCTVTSALPFRIAYWLPICVSVVPPADSITEAVAVTVIVLSIAVAPPVLRSAIVNVVVKVWPSGTRCCDGVNTKPSTAAVTAAAVPVSV